MKASGRKQWRWHPSSWVHAKFAIFLLALVIRLVAAFQIGALAISRTPHYDSHEYLSWAERVAGGDFTWPSPPDHGPGYAYFLAAILVLFGARPLAIAAVQSIIGALTCAFVADIGRTYFGVRAGTVAGVLLAIYAPLVWIDASIYAEGLMLFLMTVTVWCVATNRHPTLGAAAIALAALVRPTALVLLPLLLVFNARIWRQRALVIAIVTLLITPVTIANLRATGALIPIQAFGGMNFYLGNSPDRDGMASARPGGDWDKIEPLAARQGCVTTISQDRYFIQQTFAEIRKKPLAFLKLLAMKSVWAFQSEEIRDTHSFYFFRRAVPLLWLPSFTIVFALAAIGTLLADWRSAGVRVVACYVVLTAATTILLVVGARYRLPVVVGLALFAGLGLSELVDKWSTRRLPLLVMALLVAAAVSRIWHHAPSHNLAEEWAFSAESLTIEGNDAEAEVCARQAISTDRLNALGYDKLGVALAASSRRLEAVQPFRQAISLNPYFVSAHFHLGQLDEEMNDVDDAIAQYERAIALDPRDSRPVERLAAIVLSRGQVGRAAELYLRLVTFRPRNLEALLALARLEGALGHPDRGLAYAERERTLQEPTADTWLLIATLAADAHRPDVATDALNRAQLAGAPRPLLTLATAVLRYREGRLQEAEQLIDSVLAEAPDLVEAQRLHAVIKAQEHH